MSLSLHEMDAATTEQMQLSPRTWEAGRFDRACFRQTRDRWEERVFMARDLAP